MRIVSSLTSCTEQATFLLFEQSHVLMGIIRKQLPTVLAHAINALGTSEGTLDCARTRTELKYLG